MNLHLAFATRFAPLLAALVLSAAPGDAQQIVFRHEATLSGTLGGAPFGPTAVVLRGVGDLGNRQSFGNGYYLVHDSATVEVSGLGIFDFVSSTRTFVNNAQQLVGFARGALTGLDVLDGPFHPDLANWDMQSPVGPLTGAGGAINWDLGDVVTSGGVLDVVSGPVTVTFGASPCASSGAPFCLGDGSGPACPCGANGAPGEGCANRGGSGARLVGGGDPCYAIDSLRLEVLGVPGVRPGLLLRGNAQVQTPMADGILCTGGGVLRSQVQSTAGGATLFTDFGGQPFGAVCAPGVATHFQFLYRDTANACSGQGFNYSNGWTVTYQP